jgi:hypothetical protein
LRRDVRRREWILGTTDWRVVGTDGMTTVEGGWGIEGSIADGTCEEIDELVHGLGLMLACQTLSKAGGDQVPQVM